MNRADQTNVLKSQLRVQGSFRWAHSLADRVRRNPKPVSGALNASGPLDGPSAIFTTQLEACAGSSVPRARVCRSCRTLQSLDADSHPDQTFADLHWLATRRNH